MTVIDVKKIGKKWLVQFGHSYGLYLSEVSVRAGWFQLNIWRENHGGEAEKEPAVIKCFLSSKSQSFICVSVEMKTPPKWQRLLVCL